MNAQDISSYVIKNSATIDFQSLVKIINKYKLNYLLPSILENINKKLNFNKNISKIKLVTAQKLSTDNAESIAKKHSLRIDESEIDKNILFGYKLYTKDKIIDASFDTLLNKFSNSK